MDYHQEKNEVATQEMDAIQRMQLERKIAAMIFFALFAIMGIVYLFAHEDSASPIVTVTPAIDGEGEKYFVETPIFYMDIGPGPL